MNVHERHARLRAASLKRDGGPLGIVDVKEVVIGAADEAQAPRLWQTLLDPTAPVGATWQIGGGPALGLVPAKQNHVESLIIRVSSLERAKAFLREKQMLGADAAGAITIDPAKIGGLDVRLTER